MKILKKWRDFINKTEIKPKTTNFLFCNKRLRNRKKRKFINRNNTILKNYIEMRNNKKSLKAKRLKEISILKIDP